MKRTVTIRQAVTEDIKEIVSIWSDYAEYLEKIHPLFSKQKNADKILSDSLQILLADPEHMIAVAVCENNVCGFVHSQVMDRSPIAAPDKIGRIHDLIIDPTTTTEIRQKAYGLLLTETVDWMSNIGLKYVDLYVPFMEDVSPLERLGFFKAYHKMRGEVKKMRSIIPEARVALEMPVLYPGTDSPMK